MKMILLHPADPEHHFAQLAALFTSEADESTTEDSLKGEYARDKERVIQMAAIDEQGELLGFYWASFSRLEEGRVYLYLIVKPEQRKQGVGGRLYAHLEQALAGSATKKLRLTVRDTCPDCKAFAERRGFRERSHQFGMQLNLEMFDDRPYDAVILRLQGEGFRFTSMEELGDTEEAQRKLYELNEMTGMEIPGSGGERSWASFEDFQKSVCQAEWYRPAGQRVVIDTLTGNWAAMSAITRLAGTDYAYNLHTGVDKRYRGRKLAQAVKVTALRYARETLKTQTVRTHHNTLNLPMIAIDRKLGYVPLAGTFTLEKELGGGTTAR